MPLTLLLRLPLPGQDETEWLSVDEAGAPAGPPQRGPLGLAAEVARGAKVVALAPSTQVLLAEPELPPGSGTRLARAAPFALEEQLTEDVDQLVFALGRRNERGLTTVAVVSRSVLQGWLAALGAAGIDAATLIPDLSLLPDNPGQTVLWLEEHRLAVRRPGMLPFVVELTPVSEALALAGIIPDPDDPTDKVLESAILYVNRADWARVEHEFEGLIGQFAMLKIQILPDGPLSLLARGLAGADAVNLLQGEFARTTDYGDRWRSWRVAALLTVVLLGTHVAAQGLQIRQANRQTAALDTEIAEVFSAAMAGEPMHDARRQMQSRLDRIHRSGGGPEYFLRIMQAIGGALSGVPNTSIDGVSFHEQTLDMKVSAPAVDALSRLSQLIDGQGLSAEIQSSTPSGAGVEAHLQVRASGAKASK